MINMQRSTCKMSMIVSIVKLIIFKKQKTLYSKYTQFVLTSSAVVVQIPVDLMHFKSEGLKLNNQKNC